MKKRLIRYSAIQPQYFPRLHYFARIIDADIFVLRDDCQFVRDHRYPDGKRKKSYQAHTPIRHLSGLRLLPVSIQRQKYAPILETEILYTSGWPSEHLKDIKEGYNKSPNFRNLFDEIEQIISHHFNNLSDLNCTTLFWGLFHLLGTKIASWTDLSLDELNSRLENQDLFRLKKIMKASQMKCYKDFPNMNANEKILALIKECRANEDYCGGTGAVAYVDHKLFSKRGIKITVQDWKCSQYPQQYIDKNGFLDNLSIMDLLFNVPSDRAREILLG